MCVEASRGLVRSQFCYEIVKHITRYIYLEIDNSAPEKKMGSSISPTHLGKIKNKFIDRLSKPKSYRHGVG